MKKLFLVCLLPLRFKRALQLLKREPDPDFQDVLHQCGYYDQSHFIKSFVRYAGQSPGRYLSETKVIADMMLAIVATHA